METGIISFNMLNHKPSNFIMLLKKSKLSKNELKIFIHNEMNRYNNIIEPLLLKILTELLKTNIIFLQEVNRNFLLKLKKQFKLVYHTTNNDIIINNNKKTIIMEYRVIILSDQYSQYNPKSSDILFINDNFQKNGLMVIINDIILINVHFHWKATIYDLENFSEKIFGEIKKNTNLNKPKVIIAGDFNKGVNKVNQYFIQPVKHKLNYHIINHHKNNNYTSYNTDKDEIKEKDTIDHILTCNIKVNNNTEIIDTLDIYKIFIDLPQYIVFLKQQNIKDMNYFSDHKMIKLNCTLQFNN